MPNLDDVERAGGGTRWTGWPILMHSARTAIAAVVSLLAARLFRLQETYRAPITTLVITQSSLRRADLRLGYSVQPPLYRLHCCRVGA